MILSLACDNSKFLLQHAGVLAYPMQGNSGVFKCDAEIHPRFWSAPNRVDARGLAGRFTSMRRSSAIWKTVGIPSL